MEEAQKEPKNTLGPFLQALREAFLHLDDDEFESEVDMERRRRFCERKMPAKKYSHEDRQQLGITTMAANTKGRGISNNNYYKKLAPLPMVHVARASAVVAALPMTHVAAAATASARTGKDESARRSYTTITSGYTKDTRKRPPPSAPMESSSEGEDDISYVAKKPKYSESSSPGRSASTSSSSSITTEEANRLVGRATDYHLQQHGGWSTATTATNNNEANNVLVANYRSTPDATTPVDTVAVSPEVVGSSFSFPLPPSPRQLARRRERLATRLMAQQQREQQHVATLSSWRTLATPEPVRSISSAVATMSTAGQKKRSVTGGGCSRSYKSPSKSDRASSNDSGGGRGGVSSGGGPKSNKKKAPRPDRPRSSSRSIPRGTHLSFEMRLSHLKRFKKAYGHTLVPTIYTGYHNLGLYVSRIKHKYNNLGNMPPEQVKKLDEIGFDWSLRRKMK